MPILLAALLCLVLPQTLLAIPPDQFSFAESLAAEQDHYRAITEYKRFLHYQPDDPRAAQAQLAIARLLLKGKRWQQAEAAMEKTWRHYPGTEEARLARQLYVEAAFQREDYRLARERARQLEDLPSKAAKQQADYLIGLSFLEENRYDEAENHFANLPDPQATELLQASEEFRQLPKKSPQLAGTLSALLPGAGQLYTGRPKQAGVAFALNAAFLYGAVEAWNHEDYTVAGILSLFEIGWYGGNIYNAMNNAHKINRQRHDNAKQRLLKNVGLSLGFSGRGPWLETKVKF